MSYYLNGADLILSEEEFDPRRSTAGMSLRVEGDKWKPVPDNPRWKDNAFTQVTNIYYLSNFLFLETQHTKVFIRNMLFLSSSA